MLYDSETCYMKKAIPYLEQRTQRLCNEPLANFCVRELVEAIRDSNWTVVMDNWFPSIILFQILLDEYNLKAIGTIRKNKKKNISRRFTEKASPSTTKYCFAINQTLASYAPTQNKVVLILSSNNTISDIDRNKTKQNSISVLSTQRWNRFI